MKTEKSNIIIKDEEYSILIEFAIYEKYIEKDINSTVINLIEKSITQWVQTQEGIIFTNEYIPNLINIAYLFESYFNKSLNLRKILKNNGFSKIRIRNIKNYKYNSKDNLCKYQDSIDDLAKLLRS